MGRYHSELMKGLFPTHRANGIDLGNIEIKECNNNRHKYTLKTDDSRAQFLLFYDWMLDTFFLCNNSELPKIRAKRSISTQQVKKLAYFETKDIDELLNEIRTIIKDQTFLPEVYREQKNQKSLVQEATI